MTGQQLFLTDKFRDTNRPLLSVMCDPDSVFMRALASFKYRSLYSNIINDRTAVWYTTSISRTDPFVDIDAININYLPDYAPVIVDIANPVTPKPKLPTTSWISGDLSQLYNRAKLGLFFAIFIPIGSLLYLTNAAIQNVRSSQRIRAHAAGGTPQAYAVPLMIDRVRGTVEGLRDRVDEAFERVNASHKTEYLKNEDSEGSSDQDQPLLGDDSANQGDKRGIDRYSKVGEMEFPTLALAYSQFVMIQALNDLGWSKYPVHINKGSHSHAAIIVRMNRESLSEGKIVVGHFLDHFEV